MPSIWDNVKKSGQKTKIRGEMMLLEREANGRKKLFGIELYDLITNDKNKLLGVSAGTVFKGKIEEIKDPFERARDDIAAKQALVDGHQRNLDVLEVKGAHTLPDHTVGEKARKGGAMMSNAATATKLSGKIAWINREIKIRKEEFGMEVFGHLCGVDNAADSSTSKRGGGGLTKKLSEKMSGITQHEKDIQACIDTAINDVAVIEGKVNSKQKEMGFLDSETEPLTSSSSYNE